MRRTSSRRYTRPRPSPRWLGYFLTGIVVAYGYAALVGCAAVPGDGSPDAGAAGGKADGLEDRRRSLEGNLELAIAYGQAVVGAPYGWWFDGPLPAGEPMWTGSGPAPAPSVVRAASTNCSGLTNLMLRAIGKPVPRAAGILSGGTLAYQHHYAGVALPFEAGRDYPVGTLLGRRFRDTIDQGHVAVVIEGGKVLQSFAWERGGSLPGVNTSFTVAESHDGGFYEYVVLPHDWLGGRAADCGLGDGLYCGDHGVAGDPATLFACRGGVAAAVTACPAGCQRMPPGEDDRCAP
jgi:hypothetical protein